MKINDRVYGEIEVNEPVLIELINCGSMQRLKRVSQMGMPDEYYHKKGFSRYEHSVGVMILLKKLGASLLEQIAGLLHDVSHTAFSHVIDWVIGDVENESYQDKAFEEFIEKSEIPVILEKHGFDYKSICDFSKFTLLENDSPNICADRVDYSLREIINFEKPEKFKLILDSLVNYKGMIVFDSLDAAEIFAFGYAKCQKEHWAGEEAKARYHILSNVLKRALKLGIINNSDFWKTDYDVIKILQSSKDEEILDGLLMLRDGFIIRNSNGKNSIVLIKKFRYVNPFVLHDGVPTLLSNLSEEYNKSLTVQRDEALKKNCVEVIAK